MSFDGIEFPIEEFRIVGGLRDHVHEYPHASGGAPEKLGRKLYSIHVTGLFQTNFRTYGYTDLYPKGLANIRAKFERQLTAPLVIPTIGTIDVYAVNWTQSGTSKILSGEKVEIEFREDQSDSFLTIELVKVSFTSLRDETASLVVIAEDDGLSPDLFTGIQDAVNSLTSIGDQVDLYNDLIQVKAAAVVDQCGQLDASADELNPANVWKTLAALHDVWAAAQKLQLDAAKAAIPLKTYRTPMIMSVTDVSRALYGDNTQSLNLMRLNSLRDPLAIPADTLLTAYVKAA